MTPKDKAQELFIQFVPTAFTGDETDPKKRTDYIIHNAKLDAKYTVRAILEELREWGAPLMFEEATENDWAIKRFEFWVDVMSEIDKIDSL